MLAEINKRLGALPFRPFQVVATSGRSYLVPSPDHCTVTRLLREIVIEHDDGTTAALSAFHVAAVEVAPTAPSA
jgi:hypothetical protein